MKKRRKNSKEIMREDGLIYRNYHGYELIKPKMLRKPLIKERRHPLKEKIVGTPLQSALVSGAGAYTLLSSVFVFNKIGNNLQRASVLASATIGLSTQNCTKII